MFKPLGTKISAQVPKCFSGILTTQEDLGSSPAVALSTWNMSGRQMRSVWKHKSDLMGWTRSNELAALLTPSSAGIPLRVPPKNETFLLLPVEGGSLSAEISTEGSSSHQKQQTLINILSPTQRGGSVPQDADSLG